MHPFKSWLKNVQESLVLLDLLALYVTTLYNDTKSKQKLPIAWYLLFPVLAYFIIFVCCHCIMSVCGNKIEQKWKSIILSVKNKFINTKVSCELIGMKDFRNEIPDIAINYKDFQEPLIALTE